MHVCIRRLYNRDKDITKMEKRKILHKPQSKNRKPTKKILSNQFKLQPVHG